MDVRGSERENEAVDRTKGEERGPRRAMMKASCRHLPRRLWGLRLGPKETAFPARATSCFLRVPISESRQPCACAAESFESLQFRNGRSASLLIRRRSSRLKLTEIDLLGV